MEDLTVTATRHDGAVVWQYRGHWFSLESTADEVMTRRLIVRLGQIFTAYRQVLAPRWSAKGQLQIRVFGDTEQYRAALHAEGLDINNPAVYLVDRNMILAGSELNRFDAELAQVNRQHRQVKQQLDEELLELPSRLKELAESLKKNDIPPAERLKIVSSEQKKWEEQRKTARARSRRSNARTRQSSTKWPARW